MLFGSGKEHNMTACLLQPNVSAARVTAQAIQDAGNKKVKKKKRTTQDGGGERGMLNDKHERVPLSSIRSEHVPKLHKYLFSLSRVDPGRQYHVDIAAHHRHDWCLGGLAELSRKETRQDNSTKKRGT